MAEQERKFIQELQACRLKEQEDYDCTTTCKTSAVVTEAEQNLLTAYRSYVKNSYEPYCKHTGCWQRGKCQFHWEIDEWHRIWYATMIKWKEPKASLLEQSNNKEGCTCGRGRPKGTSNPIICSKSNNCGCRKKNLLCGWGCEFCDWSACRQQFLDSLKGKWFTLQKQAAWKAVDASPLLCSPYSLFPFDALRHGDCKYPHDAMDSRLNVFQSLQLTYSDGVQWSLFPSYIRP